jgi:hypothetical protein
MVRTYQFVGEVPSHTDVTGVAGLDQNLAARRQYSADLVQE